jgi:hypothetical protein
MSWDVDSVRKLKCLKCGNIGTITEISDDWSRHETSFTGGFTEREFPGRNRIGSTLSPRANAAGKR